MSEPQSVWYVTVPTLPADDPEPAPFPEVADIWGSWEDDATQPLDCAMGELWAQLHSQGSGEGALPFGAVCSVGVKAKEGEGLLLWKALHT